MMAAHTERERLNRIVFYGAILFLGYLAYKIIEPFLMPLAWAGILALCAYPLFGKLEQRLGPNYAAFFLTIAVALLLILPAVLLVMTLIKEASQAAPVIRKVVDDLQNHEKIMGAWNWMRDHLPLPHVDQIRARLMSLAAQLTTLLASQGGAILQNTSIFLFKLFVALFALFFFLRDSKQMGATVRKLLPFEKKRQEQLIALTRDLVFAGTTTTLAVAAAQGIAGGIIFTILGFKAPIFWGVAMGFCALLPVVGSTIIWFPATLWLIVSGEWVRGLILIGLGVGVIGMIDNLLRPFLMSGKSSMNGLLMFISLLGGVSAFGFIGLVLGPVVAATVISILQVSAATEEARKG